MKKVIFTALILAGIGISLKGAWDLSLLKRAESWPNTQATITSSTVSTKHVKYRDSDGGLVEYDEYWPYVIYEYSVNSNKYTSTRITTGFEYGYDTKLDAAEVIERYPANSMADIRYDPNDPSYSILETAPIEKDLAMIIFGLFFSLFSIGMLLLFNWLDRKS